MSTRLGTKFPNRRRVRRDPEGRFLRQLRLGPVSEWRPDLGPCMLFIGATNTSGYGQFRYLERNGYAHRYAWERVHGAIPAGMTIDHLCMVKRCVEISHLELVDGAENTRRWAASRRMCQNGLHELPEGGRCRACRRAQQLRSEFRRSNAGRGLPNRKIKFDQALVTSLIADVRSGRTTIAQAAREIGCNPNYLGRRTWQVTRSAVLGRDARCLRCGITRGVLDAHHRIPRGSGGSAIPQISFGMDNLVTLCRLCHSQVESDRSQAFDDGWLVHRGSDPSLIPVLTPWGWARVPKDDEAIVIETTRREVTRLLELVEQEFTELRKEGAP